MEIPATRYALSGDTSIAYQVFGEGELDLLVCMGPLSHIEVQWEHPLPTRFLSRIGRFARVVMFDRRGSGLSDPVDRPPTYEQQVEDAIAVLDAAGLDRVAVMAISEPTRLGTMLAATHPERVDALVLVAPAVRPAVDMRPEAMARVWDHITADWGTGKSLAVWGPHLVDDPEIVRWWGRLERAAFSPGMAKRAAELVSHSDTSGVLSAVGAPTLVIHRTSDPLVPQAESHEVADLIPGARFLTLEGQGNLAYMSDPGPLLDEVSEFLTGNRGADIPETSLVTVLFTDIVESTHLAEQLGDERWGELLETHDDAVRRQIRRFGGREVKNLGDGFMIAFEGPARALACARAAIDAARSVGVPVRAGVHIGECIRRGTDLGGVAVHVAARISALAGGGEVLCSSIVKDLVIGADLHFDDRGEHQLKGVSGGWRLFSLQAARAHPPIQ